MQMRKAIEALTHMRAVCTYFGVCGGLLGFLGGLEGEEDKGDDDDDRSDGEDGWRDEVGESLF